MHQLIPLASNNDAKGGRYEYAVLSPFPGSLNETPKKGFRSSAENSVMLALQVHLDVARYPSHFGDQVSNDRVLRPGQKLQLATLYEKCLKRTFESSMRRSNPSLTFR